MSRICKENTNLLWHWHISYDTSTNSTKMSNYIIFHFAYFWWYISVEVLNTKLVLGHNRVVILIQLLNQGTGWEWIISNLFLLVVGLFFPCVDKGTQKTLQELGGRALGHFLAHSNHYICHSHRHDPIPLAFHFHFLSGLVILLLCSNAVVLVFQLEDMSAKYN